MSLPVLPVWLLVGGIAGCLVSLFVQTRRSHSQLEDFIVGILGAILGGSLFSILSGGSAFPQVSFPHIIAAFNVAIVLLAIVRLVHGDI